MPDRAPARAFAAAAVRADGRFSRACGRVGPCSAWRSPARCCGGGRRRARRTRPSARSTRWCSRGSRPSAPSGSGTARAGPHFSSARWAWRSRSFARSCGNRMRGSARSRWLPGRRRDRPRRDPLARDARPRRPRRVVRPLRRRARARARGRGETGGGPRLRRAAGWLPPLRQRLRGADPDARARGRTTRARRRGSSPTARTARRGASSSRSADSGSSRRACSRTRESRRFPRRARAPAGAGADPGAPRGGRRSGSPRRARGSRRRDCADPRRESSAGSRPLTPISGPCDRYPTVRPKCRWKANQASRPAPGASTSGSARRRTRLRRSSASRSTAPADDGQRRHRALDLRQHGAGEHQRGEESARAAVRVLHEQGGDGERLEEQQLRLRVAARVRLRERDRGRRDPEAGDGRRRVVGDPPAQERADQGRRRGDPEEGADGHEAPRQLARGHRSPGLQDRDARRIVGHGVAEVHANAAAPCRCRARPQSARP